MNATSLYVSTCRLVLQANPEDPGCWADLYRLIPYLRQSLSCTVCGNLLIEPYTPTETNCQHHVCRSCKGGKKKLKPSCSWCKNYEKYVENVQLRILLQCYKKLCEYIINSSIYRLMCKATASNDANIANMTDLIQEGAGFKDEFKSNSGLSKSAYSILPCIYASASTQTITQAINLKNDSEITVDEDVSVAKSNLSNGSSIYSVTYAGSGNKMVIKRKAMLNKGEMENCENLRLLKGTNFKRPVHRRGNFRGRGRGFKVEDKTNTTGISNGAVSSNNLSSGRMNIKRKKLGCRCGNATASPGKLTCCGQRCPCYVDSKACLDCKCRGCRNPHTKEGQKVIRDPLDSTNSKIQSTTQLQTDECIPTRATGSIKTESRRSFRHEKKSSYIEETEDSSYSLLQREITITVESIENVDPIKIKEVVVRIEYAGNILAQSFQTPITSSKVDIGVYGCINAEEVNPQFLDEILSNPVLFTILDCTSFTCSAVPSIASPTLEKDVKKKTSKASNSPITASKSLVTSSVVLGICNLDIGSLAMVEAKEIEENSDCKSGSACDSESNFNFISIWGNFKKLPPEGSVARQVHGFRPGENVVIDEQVFPSKPKWQTRIKETLLLEPDKKLAPPDLVTWVKLPKLVVTVSTGNEPLIPYSESKFNNAVGITVESIYNVPEYISEGSLFDAIILVPSLGDRGNSVRFPGGAAVSSKDPSCRKKWLNLLHIEGLGARSKYSISPTFCDVTSTLPEHVNLENEMNKSHRLIQWNTLKNSFLIKKDVNYFYSKIMKYRAWPIEISIPNKSKDLLSKDKSAKSDKKSKPMPSTAANSDHFMAFLDLSPLLYPGITKVRVAAPLYTYSQRDIINKCGSDFPVSYSQASVVNGKLKTTSERSKASVREPEESKDSPGLPIFNDEGAPTFIIVEVELQKPFTPKKNAEYVESSLRDNISLKGTVKKKTTNLSLIQDSFSKSIKDMVSILTEEHQEFSLLFKNSDPSEDFDTAFQKFLCRRENFFKIRTTLENKVIELINEKYGEVYRNKFKEKIPEIYVYLVNEMHKITNSCLIGQENFSNIYFNTNDLQLYAEEAVEEGDFEAARDYLLLKLSRETCNPDYWLDCAVCCIGLNKYEAAVEAVREALNLNFHHQMGLLMYAMLMARFNNGNLAEQAFNVLLAKYPNFVEGWMALRLFYLAMNNSEGAFVAKQMATKIECEERLKRISHPTEPVEEDDNFQCPIYQHDENYEASREGKYGIASFRNGISWTEPLSWSISLCSPHNINLRTLIVLLKLGFYEYGSMSLSQELLSSGASEENLPPVYIYYTSVNLYLEGRYEEAIPILQNFVKDFGKDCFIWSLMGHCYYKLQNHAKAISCYEYVMESYNRPDDIHLIYLRMGMYYIQTKKFFCAKQVFVTACKYSPTPKLWKGLGIACLKMDELEEAEIAFSEANYLDNRDPESWAYLAITNAISRRLDLFKCCFSEAKKRNLQNLELKEEIKFYVNLHGLDDNDF